MILAIALAAQLANPGFERGLEGWRTEHHRGMGVGVAAVTGAALSVTILVLAYDVFA